MRRGHADTVNNDLRDPCTGAYHHLRHASSDDSVRDTGGADDDNGDRTVTS
jgi:hypothetical protein